jgi:hypothetical protein
MRIFITGGGLLANNERQRHGDTENENFKKYIEPIKNLKSNGGAPRCKQAGHARRRRIKAELYRSDPFLC